MTLDYFWWNHERRRWYISIDSTLLIGYIFLRPDAPEPTEPPPDDVADCSEVDWEVDVVDSILIRTSDPTIFDRPLEGNDITDRLDAIEARMKALEER